LKNWTTSVTSQTDPYKYQGYSDFFKDGNNNTLRIYKAD
jgi:hypothetical protein